MGQLFFEPPRGVSFCPSGVFSSLSAGGREKLGKFKFAGINFLFLRIITAWKAGRNSNSVKALKLFLPVSANLSQKNGKCECVRFRKVIPTNHKRLRVIEVDFATRTTVCDCIYICRSEKQRKFLPFRSAVQGGKFVCVCCYRHCCPSLLRVLPRCLPLPEMPFWSRILSSAKRRTKKNFRALSGMIKYARACNVRAVPVPTAEKAKKAQSAGVFAAK